MIVAGFQNSFPCVAKMVFFLTKFLSVHGTLNLYLYSYLSGSGLYEVPMELCSILVVLHRDGIVRSGTFVFSFATTFIFRRSSNVVVLFNHSTLVDNYDSDTHRFDDNATSYREKSLRR